MIGPLRIQEKSFWFRSPFGPHLLVWLIDRARGKPRGYGRYTWNWRGQAIGVTSTRDFERDPIVTSSHCRFGGDDELCNCYPGRVHPACHLPEARRHAKAPSPSLPGGTP